MSSLRPVLFPSLFASLASLVSLLGVACAPSKPGDACDLNAAEEPCPEGLVCQQAGDQGRCLVVLGGSCEDLEEELCADGAACGTDDVCGGRGATCDAETPCHEAQRCVDVEGGGTRCFPPVELRGVVIDALDETGIEGANVIALDAEGAAITPVAESGADGVYAVEVPVLRKADGSPVPFAVTLRGSARDHLPFPAGIRVALPIDLATAEDKGSALVVESPQTTLALLPLPAAEQGRAAISGRVDADPKGGVLVVAEGAGSAQSAVSDLDGSFILFNVPPGAVEVRGYAAGLQLEPVSLTVADADIEDVVLTVSANPTSTVSGSVQFVNASGGDDATSVVLVVESTFNDAVARGEVPRGLRAANVSNEFSITGVPDGDYVVLAAFENDGLVRDPDTNIAGTDLVRITVDDDVVVQDSFKITAALPVRSPGADAPEVVGPSPVFVFGDDASEDFYDIVVLDAFGEVVHTQRVDGVSGSADVSVPYDGPALEDGMVYQFRATSVRGTAPISSTEDLRGVFIVDVP